MTTISASLSLGQTSPTAGAKLGGSAMADFALLLPGTVLSNQLTVPGRQELAATGKNLPPVAGDAAPDGGATGQLSSASDDLLDASTGDDSDSSATDVDPGKADMSLLLSAFPGWAVPAAPKAVEAAPDPTDGATQVSGDPGQRVSGGQPVVPPLAINATLQSLPATVAAPSVLATNGDRAALTPTVAPPVDMRLQTLVDGKVISPLTTSLLSLSTDRTASDSTVAGNAASIPANLVKLAALSGADKDAIAKATLAAASASDAGQSAVAVTPTTGSTSIPAATSAPVATPLADGSVDPRLISAGKIDAIVARTDPAATAASPADPRAMAAAPSLAPLMSAQMSAPGAAQTAAPQVTAQVTMTPGAEPGSMTVGDGATSGLTTKVAASNGMVDASTNSLATPTPVRALPISTDPVVDAAARPAGQVFASRIVAALDMPSRSDSSRKSDGSTSDVAAAAAGSAALGINAMTARPVLAAAGASLPQLNTRDPEWIDKLVDRIDMMRSDNGIGESRIRLTPDALGPIEVKLEDAKDGQVRVHIHAEQAAARALLADAAPRLTDMAAARGLKLTHNFTGGQGQPGARDDQPQQGQQSARPARAFTDNGQITDDAGLDGRIA